MRLRRHERPRGCDAVGPARATAVAVVVLIILGGCGTGAPDLAPLSGTVSLDGRPLEQGLVQFVPETGTGPAAVGTIAGGRFVAETAGRKGARPGRYRVRIESRASPADETDTLPKSLVPERYGNPATSGIVYDLPPEGATVAEIVLESSR